MKQSLTGSWLLKKTGDSATYAATVPGCNFTDLLRAGTIPDPFYGLVEPQLQWVGESDWEYSRDFVVTKELLSSKHIFLECARLDTIAQIFVNDTAVGCAENCHRSYRFDVKHALIEGDNTIRICFRSPVNYVKEKYAQEKTPMNCNGQNGIPHIRKPQCHYGWDWGPVLPPCGIGGEIALCGYDTLRIEDICVRQTHADGVVHLSIDVGSTLFADTDVEYTVSIVAPDGDTRSYTVVGRDTIRAEHTVQSPKLWWTYELSREDKQPLYDVVVSACGEQKRVRIGLRTIELDRSRDEYGKNFMFVLNGVPIFIKGANWIPPDSFVTRYDHDKLVRDMTAVRCGNMNMLRVWGGGYYADEEMYSMCDEMGILLWQDFPFACQAYPFFMKDFLDNVLLEVEENVKRIRNHASLAVWCGNNEIEAMSGLWIARANYVEWTEKFFYDILPTSIRLYDSVTPYIEGSPCGVGHLRGTGKDNVGDTHLWAVWHGLQPLDYYRKRMTRFCSEFGFESLPDLKTIRTFASEDDYSLDSPVFTSHQKCTSGNAKMAYYIASRFRLPARFVDYIYLSQICQTECVRDATEHWRRHRDRCHGSMYWQMNDCWPVCSWAGMDYYGNYKALQYAARHFNNPITVSLENTDKEVAVYLVNDMTYDLDCVLRCRLMDYSGHVYEDVQTEVCAKALTGSPVTTYKYNAWHAHGDLKQLVFVAELIREGQTISRKTMLFGAEKTLPLPRVSIQKKVTVAHGQVVIELYADKYARYVQLFAEHNTLPFSDNFFDMLPGEHVTITQPVGEFSAEDSAQISVQSLCDIQPAGSRLHDNITRIRIMLKFSNLSGYLFRKRIPRPYKLTDKD